MTDRDPKMPHPFEVGYDVEEETYYIFAPPGCVMVGGVAVEIKDADETTHTVELSFENDELPQRLYGHVTENTEAEGGYVVEFDENATKEDAAYNFCVASFGASEHDGEQYDMCMSSINFGGEGRAGNSVYEIVTDATGSGGAERKHFSNRYYEVSGVLHEGPDVSGSLADHPNSFVAIRIASGTTSIAFYQNFQAMQADMVDQTKVVMPLYKLGATGGAAIDLRHIPRADMWSLGLPS